MQRRRMAMLVAAILIVSLVLLVGCADQGVHKETIDGHERLVRRNAFGRVMVMTCDFED